MNHLLKRWREVWNKRAEITTGLDREIQRLQQMRAEACQRYDEELASIEADIKPRMTEKAVEAEGVKVTRRSGYIRYAWDNKLLEGHCLKHPELLKFRRETPVAPSYTFKAI